MPHRADLITDYMEVMAVLQRQVMPIRARSAASVGLSRPQAEVLHLLSCRETVSIKQIAELLGITSSAATQLTEGLVAMRCVERREDASDRRKVTVRLLPAGSTKVKALREASRASIEQLLEGLSDTEITELLSVLRKLAHSCGADKDCIN